MFELSIIAITLGIVLLEGYVTGDLSFPDNESNYYNSTDIDLFSNNDTVSSTRYEFMETSTAKSIHTNLDFKILPGVSEYILTSNLTEKDRTFTCEGNKPVQWYFKQYDDNVFKKKSLSAEVFSEDRNSTTYLSFLSLNGATYLDTGRYYCAPLVGVEPKLIEKFENSSIYIFVEHETHLIASPVYFKTWFLIEDNNAFIPCRPTLPDTNVQLIAQGQDITDYTYYDEKFGFFNNSSLPISVTCIAKRNKTIEKRNFTVSMKNLVTISNKYSEHSIYGRNLTLSCSLSVFISENFYLVWIIPKKLTNQPERVMFNSIMYFYYKYGENQLSIQNVTIEDNGDYTCQLILIDNIGHVHSEAIETYKLQVNPPSKNYLNLKILNIKNRMIRPAGYNSVKWTIQVSSIPNAILYWFGPDNKKLETISEKISVNTNNESSELVIRDLQVSDSGVYRLFANNTYEKKEINVTLLVEDLEILPGLTEYILTKNSTEDDRILTCKGNEPVQWYFKQYDGILLQKNSSLLKMFSKNQDNYTYMSLLSLSKATYMDTGYYYCSPKYVESKLIKEFKNIYIYVQDETHLFAIPNDFDTINVVLLNAIVPCRTTSPDINVTFLKNGLKMNSPKYFNSKIGFKTYFIQYDEKYTCVAKRNNIIESREFITDPENDRIRINNADLDFVISGQNITLICTTIHVEYYKNLKWKISDTMKNKSELIQYDESQILYMKSGDIKLNIQNVTTENEGYYNCELTAFGRPLVEKRYELKVHEPNETHLSLRILNNRDVIIRPVGYHSVHWKIQVLARPEAIIEWRDPEGNKIEAISEKVIVKNYNNVSQLIVKNLELYDSGIYTLTAYNKVERKETHVIIFVEEKPSIIFINSLNSEDLYCEMGKVCKFKFHISGYPLPEVVWILKNCTNDTTMCDESFIPKQHIKTNNISLVTQKSLITMNFSQSITLICKASNTFGNLTKQYKVLISDEFKGFEIKGPSMIVAGDNIKVVCGASKYKYIGEITWVYPNKNLNEQNVNISENKTEFSHLSYLTIKNISNDFNGNISCTVKRKNQSIEEQPETETRTFAIRVKDSYKPVMNSLSDTITLMLIGKSVELWCRANGMPPPSISWLKNNQPLRFDESRMQLTNQNQLLVIQLTKSEDEGTYVCIATNRLGSASLIYNLSKDTQIVNVVFCCMLTIFLVVIAIGRILWFITERKIKKKVAVYRKKDYEKGALQSWNPRLEVMEQAHLLPYDNRWEFPRDKLELGEQIGSGEFGIVYKAKATGILEDNTVTTVAVKTVKPTTDPRHRIALASELKIMTHLGRHLNVVNVLGACTSSSISKKLMVIVEYCCFGSIDRYMQNHKNEFINLITPDGFIDHDVETVSKNQNYENVPFLTNTQITSDGHFIVNEVGPKKYHGHSEDNKNMNRKPLSTYDLLCWSFQISRGMEFLASRKILHGDLATRNILLAEENVVKICDFGLAKNMYKSEIYKKSKKALLPIKWLAIESMCDGIFSTASDVWSFGVVLWEIFSLAAIPYANVKIDDLLDRLVRGYRMEPPKYSNTEIYNIMSDCWKTEPTERPSFNVLAARLGDILQECTKSHYIQLNDHCVKIYDERLPSTDALSLLAAPRHSRNSLIATGSHTESNQQISMRPISKNEFEMKQTLHSADYSKLI